MPDYQKGFIYKIVCNITGEVYYGSSCDFKARKNSHSCLSNTALSRQIVARGDWKMDIIEEYPCETEKELGDREKWYIQNFPCINFKNKQTEEEKKQKKKEADDAYYQKNKDKIKKRNSDKYYANLEESREKSRIKKQKYKAKKPEAYKESNRTDYEKKCAKLVAKEVTIKAINLAIEDLAIETN